MDKYSQMKKFNYDLRLQVYMYAFMYVNTETIGDLTPMWSEKKTIVENYKKVSTPVPVTKHWLGFSYMRSEYYELYLKFDEDMFQYYAQ